MSKAEVVAINDVEVEFNMISDSKFSVSSVGIAKVFGKRHADVIRAIENIGRFEKLMNQRKIALVKYSDKKGEMRKAYQLDKDVFSKIVFGFTGKKADDWQWAYIDAFNKMEELLRTQTTNLKKLLTPIEEVAGYLEDSKTNGYPKTERVKEYCRTPRSKEKRNVEKVLKKTIKVWDRLELDIKEGLFGDDESIIFLRSQIKSKIEGLK